MPLSRENVLANPVGVGALDDPFLLRHDVDRRGRRSLQKFARLLRLPLGEAVALATDEGLYKAKYRTMLCRLPACPHPAGCFPIGKTPRDALRLVHLSPKGETRMRRETDGARAFVRRFRRLMPLGRTSSLSAARPPWRQPQLHHPRALPGSRQYGLPARQSRRSAAARRVRRRDHRSDRSPRRA